MGTKGIRGAITVDENSEDAIKFATLELLNAMIFANSIQESMISHQVQAACRGNQVCSASDMRGSGP